MASRVRTTGLAGPSTPLRLGEEPKVTEMAVSSAASAKQPPMTARDSRAGRQDAPAPADDATAVRSTTMLRV